MQDDTLDDVRQNRASGIPHTMSRLDTMPDGFADLLGRGKLAIGTIIGERYRLTASLGDGAMGQVLVAENVAIGAHVAVKVLRPELLANPEFRMRFQQEAQAVASVEHPNVARFLDLVIGDPTFLVMEYVRGPTLADTLKREKRLTPERATAIAIRVCWGLDAAHAVGVIHRDLKPANLVLAIDREHGETPKVIDFGLAKLAATASNAQLTRTGQIIGTPHYMAPEQIESREVDARTDVYALGCLLYEMLTGRTPFGEVAEDVQILYRQLHEPPRPPSTLVPEISEALDAVVLRSLAKAPSARFPSMQAMAHALAAASAPAAPPPESVESLESLRTGHFRVTAPTVVPVRAPPPPRARAVLGIAIALAVTVGMIGGVVLSRSRDASTPPPAPVVSALPVAAARASLFVFTDPTGAAVELDGKPLAEKTPLQVDNLDGGEHRLLVRLEGHLEVERWIKLVEGEKQVADLVMQASARTIQVRTVPSGAMIYVDDRLVAAASPASIIVSEDDFHEVRAEKLGFEPAIAHVAPDDRAPEVTITMEVEKLPRGYVLIDSADSAAVWIDGKETGFETPTLGIRVPSGPHTIQLVDASGQRSPVTKVEVRQGEIVRVTLSIGGEARPR